MQEGNEDDPGLPSEPDDGPGLLPRLHPGDTIGDFVVDDFHAEGGWSDVYRAHHRTRDLGAVALKIMPGGLARLPPALDGATAIPHLVEVFAAGSVPERRLAYVAMRFVAGRGLDQWLATATGPPPAVDRRELVRCFAEIASALAALHRRGIVHRDVKPANVLLEGPPERGLAGSAVLVDLGFASAAERESPLSTIYATLPYAAPEQLLGLELDGRADVFALGLCMHDLLAGRAPGRRRRRPAAGMEELTGLVPGFDPDLAAIVAEAVAPEPARRYPGAAELEDDLRRWLRRAPPSVRPRAGWQRVVRCWRRQPGVFYKRTTLGLMALGLAIVLAGVAASVLDHERTRGELRRALARGDLSLVLALEARLSPLWTGLGFASVVDAGAAGDDAVTEVLALLRAGQHAEASLRAARLLGRDGVERQPVLGAWLLGQAAAGGDQGRHAAHHLSHALYDHPVAVPGPWIARLQEGLFEQLADATDERELHALSALGGTAEPSLLPRILATWLPRLDQHRARVEFARLGIEACVRICARHESRTVDQQALDAAESALAQVAAWIGRQPDRDELRGSLQGAVTNWLLSLRRLRERRQLPPPDLQAVGLPWPPTIVDLAIAGDAVAVGRTATGESALGNPFDVGFAMGLLADPAIVATWKASPTVADAAIGGKRGWQLWAVGEQRGRSALSPSDPRYAVDPGAGLADALQADAGFVPIAATPGAAVSDLVIASWNLMPATPTLAGTAASIAGRMIRRGTDEVESDSHFVGLGCASASALQLVFREPDNPRGTLRLVLSAQKGRRGALPYCGEAGLEVLLDGHRVAIVSDLGGSSPTQMTVPGRIEVGRMRQLEIRLHADANTTVRLFEVWIE